MDSNKLSWVRVGGGGGGGLLFHQGEQTSLWDYISCKWPLFNNTKILLAKSLHLELFCDFVKLELHCSGQHTTLHLVKVVLFSGEFHLITHRIHQGFNNIT